MTLLRGTIVNRTYGIYKNLPVIYLPIFTRNSWSRLLRSPVIARRHTTHATHTCKTRHGHTYNQHATEPTINEHRLATVLMPLTGCCLAKKKQGAPFELGEAIFYGMLRPPNSAIHIPIKYCNLPPTLTSEVDDSYNVSHRLLPGDDYRLGWSVILTHHLLQARPRSHHPHPNRRGTRGNRPLLCRGRAVPISEEHARMQTEAMEEGRTYAIKISRKEEGERKEARREEPKPERPHHSTSYLYHSVPYPAKQYRNTYLILHNIIPHHTKP